MGQVLGIVYCVIATRLINKAGQRHKTAGTGAGTLIQRFGSALELNIHDQMLFLDSVYLDSANGAARILLVEAPSSTELTQRVSALYASCTDYNVLVNPPAGSTRYPCLAPNIRYDRQT